MTTMEKGRKIFPWSIMTFHNRLSPSGWPTNWFSIKIDHQNTTSLNWSNSEGTGIYTYFFLVTVLVCFSRLQWWQRTVQVTSWMLAHANKNTFHLSFLSYFIFLCTYTCNPITNHLGTNVSYFIWRWAECQVKVNFFIYIYMYFISGWKHGNL